MKRSKREIAGALSDLGTSESADINNGVSAAFVSFGADSPTEPPTGYTWDVESMNGATYHVLREAP